MYLFAKPQIEQLIKNGQPNETGKDHVPVVKLFLRGTGNIWLLTEIDPENLLCAFGLSDLANGQPILGEIDLSNIMQIKNAQGMTVERDVYFSGKYPISIYEKAAKHFGYIVEDKFLDMISPPKPPGYQL